MTCPKCGKNLVPNARFCNRCGTPITAQSSSRGYVNRSGKTTGGYRDPNYGTDYHRLTDSGGYSGGYSNDFSGYTLDYNSGAATGTGGRKKRAKTKKKSKAPVLILVTLLLILVIGVGGYVGWRLWTEDQQTQQVEDFIEAVEDGNTSRAISIYRSQINGTDSADEAKAELQNHLDEVVEQFRQGEMEYADALRKVQDVEKVGILDEDQFETIYGDLEALGDSRAAYASGEAFMEEGEYPEAIGQFSRVILEDEVCYDSAQTKITECQNAYKEQVLATADSLIAEERYAEARDTLNAALEVIPNDPEITAQRDSCLAKAKESDITTALADAETLANAGDYAGAISTIRAAQGSYSDSRLDTALADYESKYRQSVVDQAASAYGSGGYRAALNVIDNGLRVLPGDETLLEQKSRYESCAPVGLNTILVTSSRDYYSDGSITDTYGNTYSGHYYLGDESEQRFFVDHQYSNLRGTVFVKSTADTDQQCQLRIYADGVLIYDSGSMNREDKAVSFDISINDCEILEIVSTCLYYGYDCIFTEAELYNTP